MLLGFATEQLTAKPALDPLPAIADLLDGSFHSRLGRAGLLRLVSDFVILSASYPRAILLSSSAGLLLLCHSALVPPQLSPDLVNF